MSEKNIVASSELKIVKKFVDFAQSYLDFMKIKKVEDRPTQITFKQLVIWEKACTNKIKNADGSEGFRATKTTRNAELEPNCTGKHFKTVLCFPQYMRDFKITRGVFATETIFAHLDAHLDALKSAKTAEKTAAK